MIFTPPPLFFTPFTPCGNFLPHPFTPFTPWLTPPQIEGVLSIINVPSTLASAALPVYNIPNTSPHRCLEPKKAPRRLTSAGESVTIKAQREVLPIDGQPRFRLLQKSNRNFGRGRLLFCAIYVRYQNRHNDSKNHQNNRQQFIVTHQASPLSRFYP